MSYRHEIRMILLSGAILAGLALRHAEEIQLAECLICAMRAVL